MKRISKVQIYFTNIWLSTGNDVFSQHTLWIKPNLKMKRGSNKIFGNGSLSSLGDLSFPRRSYFGDNMFNNFPKHKVSSNECTSSTHLKLIFWRSFLFLFINHTVIGASFQSISLKVKSFLSAITVKSTKLKFPPAYTVD